MKNITHVINFEMPGDAESYVHRIGRTARAGSEGIALSFCDDREYGKLKDIEKLIGRPVETASGERPQRATANAPHGGRQGKWAGNKSGGGQHGRNLKRRSSRRPTRRVA